MIRRLVVLGVLFFGAVFGSRADFGAKAGVTFSKDVAPILYKHCAECHRPGDIAPMSLLTYKDARPWARAIKEKVLLREMPPWSADPRYGEFANEHRLTQKEIDTIAAWVDQGAKEGDPKDLPPLPAFDSDQVWKIGKPDAVFSMKEEYTIGAEGPDEYIYFAIPTNFKEDVWVQAAEIRPGNKRVVHHVIAFIQTPEMIARARSAFFGGPRRSRAAESEAASSIFYQDGTLFRVKMDAPVIDDGCNHASGGSAFGRDRDGSDTIGALLAGYAPGKDVDIWPAGMAKRIPAGSNILLQMHYSKTTGKVEKDRTSIGLVFAKQPPDKMIKTLGVSNHFFKIPPGAENHEVTACYTFKQDVHLIDYMPHMHLRGKDMKYEVIYPDGRRETLLWVPKFNFNWQIMYRLKKPLFIPKGTKMIITAHFDNSPKNKYNPDPTKPVRWGDPTYDEMMIGWMDYIVDNPGKPNVAKGQ
jgi:hypothetical protein